MKAENTGAAEFMSVSDVAHYFQIATSTVWRKVSEGNLPEPVRMGGCTRWIKSEIEDVRRKAIADRDAS
jgi:predicted DNA-binding transcriptional regulator AlpA